MTSAALLALLLGNLTLADAAPLKDAGARSALRATVEQELEVLPKETSAVLFVRKSRLLFYLAQTHADTNQRRDLHKRGRALARHALERDAQNPGALYWLVAHEGELAATGDLISAMRAAKEIEKHMLELKRLASGFEFGAADRVLAHLYRKAPSWISVGDKAKARAHLASALRIAPNYPGNLLAKAEALLDEDEEQQAREAARLALNEAERSSLELDRPAWIEKARSILKDTKEGG